MAFSAMRMKARSKRVILLLVTAALLLGWTVWQCPYLIPFLRYRRFVGRDRSYYERIALACDSVFLRFPVTSNDVVRLTSRIAMSYRRKVSGNDPALPDVIKELRPNWVMVGTNFVSISVPPERQGGFGVLWIQDELFPVHADNRST